MRTALVDNANRCIFIAYICKIVGLTVSTLHLFIAIKLADTPHPDSIPNAVMGVVVIATRLWIYDKAVFLSAFKTSKRRCRYKDENFKSLNLGSCSEKSWEESRMKLSG